MRDANGHTVSPRLRADQQEVDSLYAQLPTHAEGGKRELDELFASGHERRDAGQTAVARERFVAAYLLARELNFGSGEADALTLAATCSLELGELLLGVEQIEGSRRLHAKLGNADSEAEALCNLGLAHAALGDLERAQHAYRQSLRLVSDQPLRLTTLCHLGTLQLRRGRGGEAQLTLGLALALALALGDVASEVRVLQRLAATYSPPPQPGRGTDEEEAEAAGAAGAAVAGEDGASGEVSIGVAEDGAARRAATLGETGAAAERAEEAGEEAGEAGAGAEAVAVAEVEAVVEEHGGWGEGGAWRGQNEAQNAGAALRCLQRAEWLAGQAVEDGSAEAGLLLQVLRQRRAQHLAMGDTEMACECEQRIDVLVEE